MTLGCSQMQPRSSRRLSTIAPSKTWLLLHSKVGMHKTSTYCHPYSLCAQYTSHVTLKMVTPIDAEKERNMTVCTQWQCCTANRFYVQLQHKRTFIYNVLFDTCILVTDEPRQECRSIYSQVHCYSKELVSTIWQWYPAPTKSNVTAKILTQLTKVNAGI